MAMLLTRCASSSSRRAAYLLRLYLLWPRYSPGAHRAPVGERRTYYGSTYYGHATHQVRIELQSESGVPTTALLTMATLLT
eukprot:scaffold34213_cov47-Phaeocystis_antarctica.AAC.1